MRGGAKKNRRAVILGRQCLWLQGEMQGKGNEFNSPEEVMEVEADRFARRKVERLEGEIPFTTARATAAGASRGDDSVRRRGGWKRE